MKRINLFLSPLVLGLFLVASLSAHAAAATYNHNNVIDDSIFDNTSTMSTNQINTFLNTFGHSCISPNSGFMAIDPTGYTPTSGYTYGGNVTAGQVIYDAAQAYGINPQVLITTLEKEQSLVTGRNSTTYCSPADDNNHKYAAAVGYGCPDSGTKYNYSGLNLYTRNGVTQTSVGPTCVNTAIKAGFSQQVIRAAWLLKFGEQRAEGRVGWAVIKGSWINSDDPETCYAGPMTQGTFQRCPSGSSVYYDGYTTIDSTSVHMDNGATAALYWYTPHFSGNQSFSDIFNQFFGSTYDNNYQLSFYGFSGYPTIQAGGSASAWIEYQNTGSATYFNDSTAAIIGAHPLHLADSTPINRTSIFYDSATWLNNNRPSKQFAAVYESDGVTLSATQDRILTGQIVKFQYNYNVPLFTSSGTYKEPLQPILEGSPNYSVGGYGWVAVTVTNPNQRATLYITNAAISGFPGEVFPISVQYQNTGTQPLYDDTSVPVGGNPLHLANTSPINRPSIFYDSATWLNNNRPSKQFAAVYESDGVTLASNQHVAQPGQIVKFQFNYKLPFGNQPTTYNESLQTVLEGATTWDIGSSTTISVALKQPPSYQVKYSSLQGYPTIQQGTSASTWIAYQNTGTQPLYDDTSVPVGGNPLHLANTSPINRPSIFYDSATWLNNNRPSKQFAAVYESDGVTLASNQHVAQPGQIVKFQFNYSVPAGTQAKTYREPIQPVMEASRNWDIGAWGFIDVTVTP